MIEKITAANLDAIANPVLRDYATASRKPASIST